MTPDIYDEDLELPGPTLVESLAVNVDTIKTAGKIVAIPAALCLLSLAFVQYVNKKMESL